MYDDINIIKISNDKKTKFLNNNKACYVLFYKRITNENVNRQAYDKRNCFINKQIQNNY